MSTTNPIGQSSTHLGDLASDKADQALHSAQRTASEGLGRISDAAHDVHSHVAPTINRLASQAESLARRSLDAARNGSQHLREQADRVSHNTVTYIREEPVKSVLIAAAAGAALVAIASLLSRSGNR
jgi:ElaB/YqjD/DUF883 family membrane-anchored ribosome-binding protein